MRGCTAGRKSACCKTLAPGILWALECMNAEEKEKGVQIRVSRVSNALKKSAAICSSVNISSK